MAASGAVLIVHDDGSLEATPELRKFLTPGVRLELVEKHDGEMHFRMPSVMKEIKGWRDLQGILADSSFEPNAELEADRIAELERDAR